MPQLHALRNDEGWELAFKIEVILNECNEVKNPVECLNGVRSCPNTPGLLVLVLVLFEDEDEDEDEDEQQGLLATNRIGME